MAQTWLPASERKETNLKWKAKTHFWFTAEANPCYCLDTASNFVVYIQSTKSTDQRSKEDTTRAGAPRPVKLLLHTSSQPWDLMAIAPRIRNSRHVLTHFPKPYWSRTSSFLSFFPFLFLSLVRSRAFLSFSFLVGLAFSRFCLFYFFIYILILSDESWIFEGGFVSILLSNSIQEIWRELIFSSFLLRRRKEFLVRKRKLK